MSEPLPVVVLATADFRSAVWTNKQHLAVRLAETREVVYIESLGLRRPRLTRADVVRAARRLLRRGRAGGGSSVQTPRNLRVVSPLTVPLHGSWLARAVNHHLLERTVQPQLPERYVLWSFSPIVYGLGDAAAEVIYHSVDLIHHQPHMPSEAILSAERRLVEQADAVVASSAGVRDHLTGMGRKDVLLWENVADTALFGSTSSTRTPTAIFAGHLTPTKIDLPLLRGVADAGVDVVVCGPISHDGTRGSAQLDEFLAHPRVSYRGNLAPAELAEEFARAQVGLIPYLQNPYTSGVFPLKVYEYLAAGLAVVATPLPSLAGIDQGLVAVASESAFTDAVVSALIGFDEEAADDRRDAAKDHSWDARARQAEELLSRLTAAVEPEDVRVLATR